VTDAAGLLNGAASMLYPDDGYAFERPITARTAEGGPCGAPAPIPGMHDRKRNLGGDAQGRCS
jgi:hypothetical protein